MPHTEAQTLAWPLICLPEDHKPFHMLQGQPRHCLRNVQQSEGQQQPEANGVEAEADPQGEPDSALAALLHTRGTVCQAVPHSPAHREPQCKALLHTQLGTCIGLLQC